MKQTLRKKKMVNFFIVVFLVILISLVVDMDSWEVTARDRNVKFLLEMYQYRTKIGSIDTGDKSYADLLWNVMEKGTAIGLNTPEFGEYPMEIYYIWAYYKNHIVFFNTIYEKTGDMQQIIEFIGRFVIQENITGDLIWFSDYVDMEYEKQFGDGGPAEKPPGSD